MLFVWLRFFIYFCKLNLTNCKIKLMKRILLSLYLLSMACFYGYSQTGLSLSDTLGNPIAPNSTLVINSTPDKPEGVLYLWVKNNGSNAVTVKAKKVELSLLAEASVNFCWANQCYPPTVFESLANSVINAGAYAKDFSGHYQHNTKMGQSKVEWVFWDVSNPANTISVFADYNVFPVGFEEHAAEAKISGVYPNPANTNVSMTYSLPAGMNGTVILRNILGAEIRHEVLQGSSGKLTLSVSDLSDGIYFYSLLVNGESSSTGKLIVRH